MIMDDVILRINDFRPITPMKMDVSMNDVYSDASGRSSESGRMFLYPIRQDVFTIELEFLGTSDEIKAIENALAIKKTEMKINFRYNDESHEKKMYASDRLKTPVGTPEARKYRLSFNLIEV